MGGRLTWALHLVLSPIDPAPSGRDTCLATVGLQVPHTGPGIWLALGRYLLSNSGGGGGGEVGEHGTQS